MPQNHFKHSKIISILQFSIILKITQKICTGFAIFEILNDALWAKIMLKTHIFFSGKKKCYFSDIFGNVPAFHFPEKKERSFQLSGKIGKFPRKDSSRKAFRNALILLPCIYVYFYWDFSNIFVKQEVISYVLPKKFYIIYPVMYLCLLAPIRQLNNLEQSMTSCLICILMNDKCILPFIDTYTFLIMISQIYFEIELCSSKNCSYMTLQSICLVILHFFVLLVFS